ncbi:MAG: PorP/SprF family type IX secretion system membrane protein [Bacteroidales bacterium]|nr:PorP/SprF family type IX secretion system membrane protein [Bacteroidales bacterium]
MSFIFFMTKPLFCQNTPIYSHYMMDGFILNSAMAGYEGLTVVNLITRQQWLGFENAPRTFSFSFQTRLLQRSYKIIPRPLKKNRFIPARKGRVGLGGYLYTDRNGYFVNSGVAFSYAYHIPLYNSQLSLGLLGSISQHKIDEAGLGFRNPEPLIDLIANPIYIPDINIGCFYYKFYSYYIGISATNLLQSKIKFGSSVMKEFKTDRQYYLIGAYRFYKTRDLQIEPSFLYKTTEGLIMQGEASCKIYYQNKYWGGISYRTSKTIIMLLGARLKNLYMGYAFDYDFNAFQRFTFGSHELYVSMKFGETARRYLWQKRF